MANHGSKFVSVNLNKSYGQQRQPSHHAHYPDFNGGGGSYGPAGAGRGRPGSGGGGGMLVLSRARNAAPKCVPKLSVPPPLNLPSLRKEHEKFEILGPGGPGAGSGNGSRSRPTSSGMGWMKPTSPASALPEKNKVAAEPSGLDVAAASLVLGSYMPPSARSSGAGAVGAFNADRDVLPVVDKAVLLRGDDFPSLQAVRPVSSGASQKQKDGLKQKQKVAACEDVGQDKEGGYHLGPLADTDRFPSDIIGNQLAENGGKGQVAGKGRMNDQIRKQEGYLSDPLPLVRMNLRSDWADDERDTGHGFVDQGRDVGYSNIESYWDRDLDLPRPSILPHKPAAQNQDDRWGQGDIETGKKFHGEVPRVDTYNKDPRVPSRVGKEVSKWSNSSVSKDGFSSQEPGSYRAEAGSRMAGNNNSMKENKYVPPHYGDTGRDEGIVHGKESPAFGKRESGLVGWQHQQRNNTMESFNNRSRHVSESPHRFRGDNFQSNNLSRTSFASNRKMSSVAKALPNMGREKRFLNSERALSEDPFLREFGPKDFDVTDLFSQELVVGVIRRKKDASAKLTDFHDPVRESFEAELERVQKMQELERQRIIEEQEWALEQARREEEERQRRIREEEERRQKLEEEAREAAWRAEQERLEIIRKTEEQRIAREEEKKRIHLEEERRKQAAKQKLEELEARMAKRQAETSKTDAVMSKTTADEKLESEVKERCVSMNLNLDMWEDSERMVENAVASGSFDLSGHSTPVEMSLRPYPPREGSSNFSNRGKANNFWKGNLGLENSGGFLGPKLDQDAGRYSPIRNAFGGGRGIRRKEFYGGTGHMPYVEELGYLEDHRWSPSPGYDDPNGKFREMDPEFHDSYADRYNDGGWGQGRPRVNTRPPYPEHLYPHPGSNDLYNYGRSRYSVRQPHVLPPPSLVPSQRLNPRVSDKLAGPPFFLDDGIHYDSNQGGPELSEIFGMQLENNTSEHQNLNNESSCYSQSSLSVSSPPTSPLHLSHDELDESGDSGGTSSLAEGKGSILSGTQSVACDVNSRNNTMLMVSDNVSAVEDEEWTVGNENTLQQQEEYDEDEDGYREEDEVRERDNENLELLQNFERLELEEDESPHAVENVVLGFDEGVEVVIPRQDFEKTLSTEEKISFEIAENAVNIVKESGIVDGFPSDPPHYLPADDSHGIITDSSSNVPEKTASQGCIGQHIAIAASSDGTGLAAQQATSSTDAASQNSNNLPSLSSSGNQSDLPVKLQFGLFSGPSLIPSPVPAIQIGSIQMPLHIHPPLGQSMTTLMHPSQPSMFKFGQLHYTHPSSQGILPMAHQSMPFLQPDMLGHVSLNQNARDSVANEPSKKNAAKDEVSNILINHQPSIISPSAEQSQEVLNTVSNATDMNEDTSEKTNLASGSLAEGKGQTHADSKCYSPSSSQAKASELESWHAQSSMQSVIVGDRNYGGTRGLGPLSGSKGRRFAHPVKNKYMRVSIQDHGMPSDSNRFQRRPRRTVQRTEFRVRENSDRRPPPVSSNNLGPDEKSNYNGKVVGVFARSGSKRGTVSNRTMKRRIESESSVSGSVTSQEVSGDRAAKELAKDMSQHASNPGEANLRKNASEEDVDAPLQSGVVHVFKQPGIEAPSDEDDFIEVRSKRQMVNDRREQREKEIKAKSRTTKPPRKPRASRPMDVVSRIYNKLPIPSGIPEAKSSRLEFTSSESPSTGYTIVVSQPPIGTLPISSDDLSSNWSAQAGPVSVVSDGGAEHESGLNIDSKNKVMSLSQSQIDEAMKPARYDSHISTDESHSSTVTDPILPSSSILRKEKTFSSGSSPISSLLAGEKIQFGAVTSPTVLPPTTRAASHVIGAPGSNRPDAQKSCSLPLSEKDDSLFFSKEKPLNEPVQDCEAEAEAAASAVAVAAISSDEIVENGNDAKSFTDCVSGITTGAVSNRHITSQSQSEESLSVSLPADLSVETTPISLWPPLPSPQNSSGQMLSHFPSGPPSHFPFYEMNPLVGGPIFTFSPHEESSGNQSQPPKNVVPASGPPLGNWTSGVDSFYGAPSGYPGPFISPHGVIPSVQGPTPHMVVYNHFAPVGQYAQVGLSFMGTTYIPSGKQGDWKNNVPASSAVHSGAQGDMNNVNVSNVQRGGPNMTPPIQHLASGSPLLHMPPPMPMFDVSPFQTASGLSAQARWGHIPSSPIPPVSRSPQSQTEGPLHPEVNHPGNSMDQSQGANRFIESHTPTQSDTKNLSFNVSSDSTLGPFPSQLGFSDPLRSVSPAPKSGVAVQTLPNSSNPENIKSDTAKNDKPQNPSALKAQFPKKSVSSVQQGNNNYNNINNNNNNPSRYGYQRSGGMMSHRHSSGSDYSHRKMGYHGRNQSGGVDKGFHTSKVKQIYVAKQTNGTGPTA